MVVRPARRLASRAVPTTEVGRCFRANGLQRPESERVAIGREPNPTIHGRAEREFHQVLVEHAATLDWHPPAIETEIATNVGGVGIEIEVVDRVLGYVVLLWARSISE